MWEEGGETGGKDKINFIIFMNSSTNRRHFLRGTGALIAAIRADGRLENFVKERYGNWDTGIGKDIEGGQASFDSLDTYMLDKGDVTPNASGRQEFLENLINEFI